MQGEFQIKLQPRFQTKRRLRGNIFRWKLSIKRYLELPIVTPKAKGDNPK